jgi:hypothetical protein
MKMLELETFHKEAKMDMMMSDMVVCFGETDPGTIADRKHLKFSMKKPAAANWCCGVLN